MNKLASVFLWLFFLSNFFFVSHKSNGQCSIQAAFSGTVLDNTGTVLIQYSINMTSTCSFINIGACNVCGINFPAIPATWSGNSNVNSTVTYTFTVPITSLDLFIAYTGIYGTYLPETFLFNTNGGTPSVSVYSGTCGPWIVSGNQSTSPN